MKTQIKAICLLILLFSVFLITFTAPVKAGCVEDCAYGSGNGAIGSYAVVSGGSYNEANNSYSTISSGHSNTVDGYAATISGGLDNFNDDGAYAIISGGRCNETSGWYSTISGGKNVEKRNQVNTVTLLVVKKHLHSSLFSSRMIH